MLRELESSDVTSLSDNKLGKTGLPRDSPSVHSKRIGISAPYLHSVIADVKMVHEGGTRSPLNVTLIHISLGKCYKEDGRRDLVGP